MRRISLLLLAFMTATIYAQDTVRVQTFEFSDIHKRRGWFDFPPDTARWEKVLMNYTLKCDPLTPYDSYDCGEWDYTTYTYIYDHTGELDSNVQSHPNFIVQGSTPDTFAYHNSAMYTHTEEWQYFTVYDVVASESDHTVGSGSIGLNHTAQTSLQDGRSQYLFTAAELTGAGLVAGDIHKLRIDVAALGLDLDYFTVQMKHSAWSTIDETNHETTGWTEVYRMNTVIGATGIFDLNFTTPFNWDGVSNVAVQFCYDNDVTGPDFSILGSATGSSMGVHNTSDDPYLDFQWGEYIEVPASAFDNIDSNITISLWVNGDPMTQPLNNYTFEANDAFNQRVINVHLPWSNSNVYWDCGNDGGYYDRINAPASFNDFAGEWNHWAFTKNVATGQMNIYLNGVLWLSGSGKDQLIDEITSFRIGGPADGSGRYDGYIDEFRIWSTDLSATEIADWMYKDIDPTHPAYAELELYYKFDEGTGIQVTDDSGNGNDGTMIGLPQWMDDGGCSMVSNLNAVWERPNLTFVQGIYTTHLDSILVLDSTLIAPLTVLEFNDTTLMPIASDTMYVWPVGYSYTYDGNGNVIDSTWYGPTDSLFRNDGSYWNVYDVVDTYQLQNYVTPYGIGLSLGPDGFRWQYEVTDYHLLLHDSVDLQAHNTQELIDLEFLFVTGVPPRDVIDIDQLWRGQFNHVDIADDVTMQAIDVPLNPAATDYVIKTRTTGHGWDNPTNCLEFCEKDNFLEINGVQEFLWTVWEECALNPVYPQGGTWLIDRAGWCPGQFGTTYDHDLTGLVNPGDTISVDYGMEPYPGATDYGNYRIAVQLFSYTAPNHTLDAAIEDIVAPNDWEFHKRNNPICGNPVVLIKNTGSTPLTQLDIRYWCDGGYDKVHTWTGNLEFMDTAYVHLQVNDPTWWEPTRFHARVENPNTGVDQYSNNDEMSTSFELPPSYPNTFAVWCQSNLAPNETDWYIKDELGNVVYSRTTFAPTTLYRDTVTLADGCYTFEVYDTDDDGLGWWANSDGVGMLRFRDISSPIVLKIFGVDFGRSIIHHFTVGGTVNVEEYAQESTMYAYPNPTTGQLNIDLEFFGGDRLSLDLYDAQGRLVISEQLANTYQLFTHVFDLTAQERGMYMLRVSDGEESRMQQIVLE